MNPVWQVPLTMGATILGLLLGGWLAVKDYERYARKRRAERGGEDA